MRAGGAQLHVLPSMDHSFPPADQMLRLAREACSWEGPVLVHCANGHGRSASLVALIMVLKGDAETCEEAFRTMRASRPKVHIVEAQARVLRQLEQDMKRRL